jgi:hypothetical protein
VSPPGCAPAVRRSVALFSTALLLVAAAPGGIGPRFTHWIDGTAPSEPDTQVQRIDADTLVIRQSVKTNFEAPFLYLLFGKDRVLRCLSTAVRADLRSGRQWTG